MIRSNIALWALLGFVATGCAGSGTKLEPPEPRSLGRDIPTFVAPEDPNETVQETVEEPSGDLTLRHALTQALLQSPDLASFSWQVRVQEAEALQAGLRLNPGFGVELENFGGSGDFEGLDGSETTVFLSQLIQLGGKRGKRRDVADLDHNLSMWDYESLRLDLFTEVAQAFVSVLAAQERVRISQDLVTVAEQSLETVSRRVRAGAVSVVEETRAQVALSTSRLDLQTNQRQLAVERRRLAGLWGSSTPQFTQAVGTLDAVTEPVPLDTLLTRVEGNPDVARWLTEVEQRRADLAWQRSLGTPDVTVFGGLRHLSEPSVNAFILGLEIPLPIADRNQGGSRAAEYRLAQVHEEQRSALVAAQTDLATTYEGWVAAHLEITTLEEQILPDAELALETAQDAYQRGLFRLTDVLDTQRTLFQLRSQRMDSLERYHHARSQLERLIGEALTGQEEIEP